MIKYQILSFSPLPTGWVNLYRDKDGGHHAESCPGILVVREDDGTVSAYFASSELGHLCLAEEIDNYADSYGPRVE